MTFAAEVTVGTVTLRGITPENRKATVAAYGDDPVAIRAACDHAFRTLGLHRVQVWLAADDPARAAFDAVGFVTEGVARDRIRRDDRWHDAVLLGLLARELA